MSPFLREAERLAVLQELATHLISAPLDAVFDASLDVIDRGLGIPRSAILVHDDGGTRFKAHRGVSDAYRTAVEHLCPWAQDDALPQPVVVGDVALRESLRPHLDALSAESIGALVGLPIMTADGLIGRLMMYDEHPRIWTPAEIRFGQTIASLVAIVVHRTDVESTLRSANTELTALAQHIPVGVVFEDRSRRIRFYNQPFLDMAGLSDADLSGGPRSEDVAIAQQGILADPDGFHARVREIARKGDPVQGEELALRDGRIVEQGYSPIADEGEVFGHLWSYRDVTEQRWMERQVVQRTKMESLGALAGGIAHDFNNLLTSILGYGAMARKEVGNDHPAMSHLHQLLKVAGQAAEITRQLKTFSAHPPRGDEALDITRIVWEAAEMLRRLLGPNIDLTCEGLGEPLWVNASASQVNQVLINLVVNARDAMPEGGELKISLRPGTPSRPGPESEPGSSYVLMSVSDTGVGMDDVTKHRIFEPFFTTKGIGEGSGLGLSTCYGIVTSNGGALEYDTVPGEGTTFRVFWPEGTAQEAAGTPARDRRVALPASVLVVEDEPFVRDVLREALLSEGYETVSVGDGRSALDLFDHGRRFDLVITDAAMPGISGPELIQTLRLEYPSTATLLISGYVGDRDQNRDVPFLQKPFLPEEFIRKVVETLANRHIKEDREPGVA